MVNTLDKDTIWILNIKDEYIERVKIYEYLVFQKNYTKIYFGSQKFKKKHGYCQAYDYFLALTFTSRIGGIMNGQCHIFGYGTIQGASLPSNPLELLQSSDLSISRIFSAVLAGLHFTLVSN